MFGFQIDTRVDRILPHILGPDVLDIGCTAHDQNLDSPLWLHGALCKRFPNVVGIDINQQRLDDLRRAGYSNVHYAAAESFRLSAKFDTIVAGELIEHLSNPGLFLERTKEHLKEGGRLILTTPQPFAAITVGYAVLKYPNTCANWEHVCWYCPRTLKELCRRHGLKVTYWDLIEDYRTEVTAPKYRWFMKLLSVSHFMMPKILRCNAMLLVVEQVAV